MLRHTMSSQEVFSVGNRRYMWADVMLAARLWGDWARLERDVRYGIACLKRMQDTGEELGGAEMRAAVRAFRDIRNLKTADAVEGWLQQRHLTVEMRLAYLRRSRLRQQWAAQFVDILTRYRVKDTEVERDIIAEGICSGQFAMLARKLAARAAVYEKATTPQAPGGCPATDLNCPRQALAPEPASYQSPGLSPKPYQEQMKTLACLEIVCQRFCQEAPTAKAIQEYVRIHHLDWIRLDCRYVICREEQMAREAALCAREDRMAFATIAAQAKTTLYRTRCYLEQMEPSLKPYFLCVRQGDLLGAFRLGGEFAMFWVLDKILPSIAAADIRQRPE
jgi:hypothetical protein